VRALVVVCLLCATAVAAPDERPWAKGVSAADQKAALALYDEGNKFFEESEYKEALEKYEQALVHWQHPAIYFNAAVCLHHLDQDV
jgi:tetratricopeptide (TPR) repeat protein